MVVDLADRDEVVLDGGPNVFDGHVVIFRSTSSRVVTPWLRQSEVDGDALVARIQDEALRCDRPVQAGRQMGAKPL